MSHTLRSQGRRKIQNQDEGIKIIFKAVPSYPENHLRLVYSLRIPDSSHTHTHRYTHACALSQMYINLIHQIFLFLEAFYLADSRKVKISNMPLIY